MASATRPASVRGEVEERTPTAGATLLYLTGAVFWSWLLFRWVNRLLGGAFIPVDEPLLAAETAAGALAGLPVLGTYADPIGFTASILPTLADGLWLTVTITVVSLVVGFFIAVPLAVARVYGHYTSYVSLAYTELLRGTPLLAQLFVLHFGLDVGQYVPAFAADVFSRNVVWVAILGFVLNGAAYQAEYFRGAIESVGEGQITAGRAIGLSKIETIYYVVLPQGLRYAIPSWTNEFVYLIKYSSLAAFITVPELYYLAFNVASETFRYTTIFIVTGLCYLALVITATKIMGRVEAAVAIPGIGNVGGRD
ncbi:MULTISPECIES: amino acid ABC transporter permease [unclassified Haloparvum]|uniref:amino acid ABC transporter permease n=1 Tax=Haloparvum sp. PAK95 TaxID=3418962 RepID=UPI003D2F027A